jgi:hypothetical protein
VIHLKVVNEDPELAAKIANSWSNNFMKDTKELRQSEVREVNNLIQEQFDVTQEKLKLAKNNLKDYKEEVRLEVLKNELDNKNQQLDKYNSSIENLKTELGVQKAKFNHLNNTISKMESNNNWNGDLKLVIIEENYNQNIINSKEKYLDAQNRLLKFEENHDISNLKKEINTENKILLEYQNELAKLETLSKKENNDKIISLKNNLISEMAKKEHLEEEISDREVNGIWVGDLNNSNQQLNIKKNYINAHQNLLTYKENHDIKYLQLQISLDSNRLKEFENKLSNLENKLEEKRSENQKIKALLDNESDRWELKKSITNDVLWEKILSPEQMNSIKNLKLTDEIVNPIYRSLRQRLSENEIIIDSYPMTN